MILSTFIIIVASAFVGGTVLGSGTTYLIRNYQEERQLRREREGLVAEFRAYSDNVYESQTYD